MTHGLPSASIRKWQYLHPIRWEVFKIKIYCIHSFINSKIYTVKIGLRDLWSLPFPMGFVIPWSCQRVVLFSAVPSLFFFLDFRFDLLWLSSCSSRFVSTKNSASQIVHRNTITEVKVKIKGIYIICAVLTYRYKHKSREKHFVLIY